MLVFNVAGLNSGGYLFGVGVLDGIYHHNKNAAASARAWSEMLGKEAIAVSSSVTL